MNGLPYYRAYPRDFVEGTVGMAFELKGAYRLLIDLIYMQDGKLPDDARYISGLLGCSVRKWNSYREKLISMGKIKAENEIISNFRADKELVISRTLRDKNAESASKRWKNNNLADANAKLTGAYSATDTYKEGITRVIPKKKRSTRGSRLPEDWEPSQALILWALEKGITDGVIAEQTERFRDWWPAQPGQKGVKVDWDLTWKNWMRKSHDEGKRTPTIQRANDIESYKRNACTVLEEVIAHNEAVDAAGSGAGDIGQDEGTSQRRLAETAD